jgi:8-oxo-dGTP pyrophosphatase MutT (NUDIX family)
MDNIPNCFYRTSIKALVLDENQRFMLVLQTDGLWELPGGGLDFGETPEACVKRELQEEMGLEVTSVAKSPSYFVTAQSLNKTWKGIVVYETKVKDLDFTTSDECIEMRFFSKDEALKENLYPAIKEFVLSFDPERHH